MLSDILQNFHFLLRIKDAHLYQTAEEGAATQIVFSVDPKLKNISGKYFVKCKEKDTSKEAQGDDRSKWLLNESVTLAKLKNFI